MKKILLSFLLGAAILSACTNQPSTSSSNVGSTDSIDAIAAINKADSAWDIASSQNSAEGWLSFYTDDAIMMPPGEAVCTDKSSREKSIKNMFAYPGVKMRFQATKTEVSKSADLGYSTGPYQFSYLDASGKEVKEIGKFCETWKKQADGSWKCIVDIWNADPAPTK